MHQHLPRTRLWSRLFDEMDLVLVVVERSDILIPGELLVRTYDPERWVIEDLAGAVGICKTAVWHLKEWVGWWVTIGETLPIDVPSYITPTMSA